MTTHPSLANWYSVQDIATELGVTPFVVKSMITKGELPAIKVGRAYRIKVDDLAAWIAAQETS